MTAERFIQKYRNDNPIPDGKYVFSFEECRQMMLAFAEHHRKKVLKAAYDNSMLLVSNIFDKSKEYVSTYKHSGDNVTVSRDYIVDSYPKSNIK